MNLNTLRELFDAVGQAVDLYGEAAGSAAARSHTALLLGTLFNLIEEGAFASRAGAITRVALAFDKAEETGRFPEGWTLGDSLKALRLAWYPDDFNTIKQVSTQCWWAVNAACKLQEDLNREKP